MRTSSAHSRVAKWNKKNKIAMTSLCCARALKTMHRHAPCLAKLSPRHDWDEVRRSFSRKHHAQKSGAHEKKKSGTICTPKKDFENEKAISGVRFLDNNFVIFFYEITGWFFRVFFFSKAVSAWL